jgi:Kef-type K+ transport system membrane component KefB
MSFATLALISVVAVLGPLLALPRRWHLPVVLGELVAGIVLGPTGFGSLHAGNGTFTFLANVGFALVMFVAGSHVPVRDLRLRAALPIGIARALGVGVLSILLAVVVARLFGTGHAFLYAVLMASSSAALILPVVDSLHLGGPSVLQLLPQVAIADVACIVALPLAVDPGHAGRAALGATAVVISAVALFVILRYVQRTGIRRRVHRISEEHKFALELRMSLAIVFCMAALATRTHVSVMLAGFCVGLAVAGVGAPRRLAKQLFAVTEGFLGPLFFVWLGASLDLRELGRHPSLILLGVVLGVGAVAVHVAIGFTGQPVSIGALASAQLGVPVAAVTIGSQLQVLNPGEPAALILGALVTIAVAVVCGGLAVRQGQVAASGPPGPHGGQPSAAGGAPAG